MDSLGFDRHGGSQQVKAIHGKPSISFIRYKDPIASTGEDFEYRIEESTNLRVWKTANVRLVSTIEIGEDMEQVTYQSTSSSLQPSNFLRLRIISP